MDQLIDIFLHKMPTQLLLAVGSYTRTYVSVVARACDCTYPHAVKTLYEMEQLGLVKSEKLGRVKYVELTDNGRQIEHALHQLMKAFGVTHLTTTDEVASIDSKIDNILAKLFTIHKTITESPQLTADDLTKLGRRLGPYYRELKTIEGLSKAHRTSHLTEKIAEVKSTLNDVKAELMKKRQIERTSPH